MYWFFSAKLIRNWGILRRLFVGCRYAWTSCHYSKRVHMVHLTKVRQLSFAYLLLNRSLYFILPRICLSHSTMLKRRGVSFTYNLHMPHDGEKLRSTWRNGDAAPVHCWRQSFACEIIVWKVRHARLHCKYISWGPLSRCVRVWGIVNDWVSDSVYNWILMCSVLRVRRSSTILFRVHITEIKLYQSQFICPKHAHTHKRI